VLPVTIDQPDPPSATVDAELSDAQAVSTSACEAGAPRLSDPSAVAAFAMLVTTADRDSHGLSPATSNTVRIIDMTGLVGDMYALPAARGLRETQIPQRVTPDALLVPFGGPSGSQ
jgi:hypothetical protein